MSRTIMSALGIGMYGIGMAAGVRLLVHHTTSIWLGVLCLAGCALGMIEEIRILLADRAALSKARGFEVKLPMGETPMLLQKEDDHG